MSKQANTSLIGVFVLGALVLVITGVIVFGSGKFFRKVDRGVMFFEGSVKGLQIGSPVVFRGVQIGMVTNIVLEVNVRDLAAFIPVYAEIYPQSIVPIGGRRSYDEQYLQALIKKGLRAQLQLQSFVTGQLMVSLDFHPDTPIKLVGLETRYPEIPTIPSDLERLRTRFEELPLKEIAERLNETVAGINKLVASRDLQVSLASFNRFLENADALVKNLNNEVRPLASDIKTTTDAVRTALVQVEKTLKFDEGEPGRIASNINDTLTAGQNTLKEADKAVQNISGIATQNANIGYEVSRTLEQIAELLRSIRNLADYLERHPEALFRGKRPAEGE